MMGVDPKAEITVNSSLLTVALWTAFMSAALKGSIYTQPLVMAGSLAALAFAALTFAVIFMLAKRANRSYQKEVGQNHERAYNQMCRSGMKR